jgi:16S rRNA (guanine527-N7)-methyltransferase
MPWSGGLCSATGPCRAVPRGTSSRCRVLHASRTPGPWLALAWSYAASNHRASKRVNPANPGERRTLLTLRGRCSTWNIACLFTWRGAPGRASPVNIDCFSVIPGVSPPLLGGVGLGSGTMENTRASTQLTAFAAAVRASPHNLLSARALEELESRHIAESRAFAASLPTDCRDVLDLGTGGGFPGMVIAIERPDLRVTLLDATRKKIEFLQEVAASLGLDVSTVHGRAEDLHTTHAGAFDVVTARAVAPLEQLVPWALPFLAPGGQLHAIKGERWPDELRAALPVIQRSGATVVRVPGQEKVSPSAGEGSPAMPRVVIIQAAG